MRTYTHGAIGYMLYLRGSTADRRLAAIGGLLPDAILGVGYVFHVAERWTTMPVVADLHRLFHHSALHVVTVALHSLVIVVPLLVAASLFWRRVTPLLAGMLSHSAVDLLTHRMSAYNHAFPIPMAPMESPLDYRDPGFAILEHLALLVFVGWMVWRWRRAPGRA